jgi:hypothetical protein
MTLVEVLVPSGSLLCEWSTNAAVVARVARMRELVVIAETSQYS